MGSEAPQKEEDKTGVDVAAEKQPSPAPKDDKARLEELVAIASAKHASRNYETAADLFSQATELQTRLNGEMSTENAELLFLYGRSLFQLAVQNSDVLGSKVPVQQNLPSLGEQNAEGAALAAVSEAMANKSGKKIEQAAEGENKSNPLFSFNGDETIEADDDDDDEDEDEDDDDGEEGQEGQDEEDDDFANAFETLDLARILLLKKLDDTSKESDSDEKVRSIKMRLADTYGLQAEISLEGENFTQAVSDYTDALKITQELFPVESSRVAEGHYMLALALEMCPEEEKKENKDKDAANAPETAPTEEKHGDTLEQARSHMRLAIDSCKARIANEKQRIAETKDEALSDKLSKGVAEVEEIVSEMQQRLHDMRKPAASLDNVTGASAIEGLLGQMLGQPPLNQDKRLEEAQKSANDVSGLVKKRKKDNSDEKPAEKDSEKKPRT